MTRETLISCYVTGAFVHGFSHVHAAYEGAFHGASTQTTDTKLASRTALLVTLLLLTAASIGWPVSILWQFYVRAKGPNGSE